MDYKNKYKNALRWIESIYPTLQHEQQMEAEGVFPELAEVEDKKIKRCIGDVVRKYGSEFTSGTVTKEKNVCLA